MSPKQIANGVLFKGVTSTKTLLPLARGSSNQTGSGNQTNGNPWAEEQRLKKFLKEFEDVDFGFQNAPNVDPL
jgi:hypothetical protein